MRNRITYDDRVRDEKALQKTEEERLDPQYADAPPKPEKEHVKHGNMEHGTKIIHSHSSR